MGAKQFVESFELSVGNEGHRYPVPSHSACASYAVGVRLVRVRKVVVDHMANVCKIQSASSNISGHQQAYPFVFESVKN